TSGAGPGSPAAPVCSPRNLLCVGELAPVLVAVFATRLLAARGLDDPAALDQAHFAQRHLEDLAGGASDLAFEGDLLLGIIRLRAFAHENHALRSRTRIGDAEGHATSGQHARH